MRYAKVLLREVQFSVFDIEHIILGHLRNLLISEEISLNV